MNLMLSRYGNGARKLKGWEWLPGMRGITTKGKKFRVRINNGIKVIVDYEPDIEYPSLHRGLDRKFMEDDSIPDLNDSATIGCLLQLLKRKYSIYKIISTSESSLIMLEDYEGLIMEGNGDTLGEACYKVALELGGWN